MATTLLSIVEDMPYLTHITTKILTDQRLWIMAPPFLDDRGKPLRTDEWREALKTWKSHHPSLQFHWSCAPCNAKHLRDTPGTIVTSVGRGKQCSQCELECTLVRYAFDLKTNEPKDAVSLLACIAPEYQIKNRTGDLQVVFRSHLAALKAPSKGGAKGSKIAQIKQRMKEEAEGKTRELLRQVQDGSSTLTQADRDMLEKQVTEAKREKDRLREVELVQLKRQGQQSLFAMLPTVQKDMVKGKGKVLLGAVNPVQLRKHEKKPRTSVMSGKKHPRE